jgi:tetratricopeptide (TPR) repeat protein
MVKKKTTTKEIPTIDSLKHATPASWTSNNLNKLGYWIVFLAAILLYSNTLFNGYAIDDGIVITENKLTQRGCAGIKDILTHDAFYGCLGENASQLVQGGRYRPLSIVSFAIEYEIWGMKPAISHGINVLLFAFTCIVFLRLLIKISGKTEAQPMFAHWAFWASLLFAVHPIHTEVVANIKGRDEILGLLFALLALYGAIEYTYTQKTKTLIAVPIFFFLSLLSKENSITFVAIIPLAFYFFTPAQKKDYLKIITAVALPTLLFLILRSQFASANFTASSGEILNNPFLLASSTERYATILLSWIYYLKLLIMPITLSHDYYFNQIPYAHFSNPAVLISLIVHLAIAFYCFKTFTSKKLLTFAILFYFITFSVVSNLFFSVGILMNERFVFVSSLGFCIAAAYCLFQLVQSNKLSATSLNLLLIGICSLYSIKTFSRNFDWKSNLSLLAADVQSSPNSAKANSTYAGLLYEESLKTTDTLVQKEMLDEAYEHVQTALSIYPNYSDALQIMGNVLYKHKKDFPGAIAAYQKSMQINTLSNPKLVTNLALAQIQNNQAAEAKRNLLLSNQMMPDQYATIFSLAEAYSKLNQADSSIYWYQKSIALKPKEGIGYYRVASIFGKQLNQLSTCIEWLNKAIELDPKNLVYLEDLAVANGLSGNTDVSISVAKSILSINPRYQPAYSILYTSFIKKGDGVSAQKYLSQLQQIQSKK